MPPKQPVRINRNIVECKGIFLSCSEVLICINRNIVECKERLRKIGYYGNIVLIETLWNVK